MAERPLKVEFLVEHWSEEVLPHGSRRLCLKESNGDGGKESVAPVPAPADDATADSSEEKRVSSPRRKFCRVELGVHPRGFEASVPESREAAELLREVWSLDEDDPPEGEAAPTAEASADFSFSSEFPRERRKALLETLRRINFLSGVQAQRMLEAPLSEWRSLMNSPLERTADKRFLRNAGQTPGADFVLYRHQNGWASA